MYTGVCVYNIMLLTLELDKEKTLREDAQLNKKMMFVLMMSVEH